MTWKEKIRKWILFLGMCGLIFQFVLPARAQEAEIIVEDMVSLEDGEIVDEPAEVILDVQGISGAAEVIDVQGEELENTEKHAEDTAENPEEITWEIVEEDIENKDGISSSLSGNYEISPDGCSASRKEETDSGLQVEYHIYANPDIEEELDSEDFAFLQNPELIFPENAVSIADGDYKKFTSIEMAGTEVRQKLKEREPMFEIGYRMDSSDGYTNLGRDILNEAIKHTGKPTEGDYLRQTWSRMYTRIQSTVNKGIWTGVIQFAIEYYTSTEQEAAVDRKVAEIINDLKLEEKEDYEKIRAIYDYLCKNITYDNRYLESDTYHLDHSAYAALIQGTSVCSGYAYSFYRIALEEGIDTRVVGGANHAWNIVKLENRYYNLDATWDAPNAQNGRSYRYFLKCPQNFTDHYREELYVSEHFNYQYPMADRDYDAGAPGEWPGSGTCGEQLTWILDDQGVLTIRGNGAMTDYSDENPSPWEAQKVRKVVIGEGITGIGASAFYYCTKMTEAVLPQSLKTIGDYAFSWCGSLKEIVFPQNLTGIGINAFYKCTGLTELSIPGTVESIGTKAFYDAVELKKVTMEDGVKGLEEFVFQGCVNLKEVSFPISAADANRNIFTDCLNLADLTITGKGAVGVYATDRKAPWNRASLENLVIGNEITEIGEYAFYNMDGLRSVFIPGQVTRIGGYGFYDCDRLEEVTISDGITELGEQSFYSCASLPEITIPGSVKLVGNSAFRYCKSLKKVMICDGAGTLAELSFRNCANLQSVSIPADIQAEKEGVFAGCPVLTQFTITGTGAIPDFGDRIRPWALASVNTVIVQEGITSVGIRTFYNMDGLKTVSLPAGITKIGAEAFSRSDGLEEIKLPDGISEISEKLFYACKGLKSVVIPEKVTKIGASAFNSCDNLTAVTISSKVTEIGESCFYNCSGLTKITIPGSVKTVGGRAFGFCKKLKTVEISDGVEKLSDFAFYGCDTLQSVTIPAGTQPVNGGVFNKCPLLTQFTITGTGKMPNYENKTRAWASSTVNTVAVQDGITSVGVRTFYNMDGLKSVILPESITKIEKEAFAGSDSLTEIELPEKLKEIDEKAFYACKGLQSVSIGKNVTKIGANAFNGSSALKLSVTYGSKAEEYAKANNVPYVSDALKAPEMKKAENEKAGVKITWKKVFGAEGYRVFRKNGDKWKKIGDAKEGNNAVYTDKTVKSGTKYTYKVCALKNEKVISDLSANSADCLYLAPTSLRSVAGKAGKKAMVKWKKSGKGDGYELRFRRGKTTKKVKVKNVGTVLQTVELPKTGTYEVSIRSYKKSGGTTWYSVWSNIKKVTVKK